MGDRSANGGINSLFELSKSLQAHKIHLFSQREDRSWERWQQAGIQVSIISHSRRASERKHRSHSGYLHFIRKLRNYWKACRPDVVICNDVRAMIHAAPIARMMGIPVAFFVRDIFPPERSYGLKWRTIASSSDMLICLSREMSEQLKQRLKPLFGGTLPLETVYSVVDFQRMQPITWEARQTLREQKRIPPEQFAVCYAAGFCDKKNQLGILREFSALLGRAPDLHLHFVGDFRPDDDAYSRACQTQVQQAGLEHQVTFHGYSDKIEEWYRLADCTLLASRREGLARCMIESLACGTPVISFDVTSAREILLDHHCGLVSPQGDYADLWANLTKLADDTPLRTQFRECGITTTRKLFSPQQSQLKLNHILQTLTKIAVANELRSS